MEVATATLCSLDEKPSLALLAAILTTLLIAAIVALAAAAVIGCKIRQEKREKTTESIKSPIEESSKDRQELILPIVSTSGHVVQSADVLYFSRELVKYCTSIPATVPMQTVSVDDEGELVAS
ncbi:MAG: hypothetical protein MJE68_01180 [Proteobacteria bacterium]|nr:hypothetical protein [Pseudomonadota bacterium]